MRTDTATFRRRIFAQVRALGINSVRSKIVAQRIVAGIRYDSYNPYNAFDGRATIDSITMKLLLGFGGHFVRVVLDDDTSFTESTDERILVDTSANDEQVALRPLIEDAAYALRRVRAAACRDWDEANGHPATNDLAEVRFRTVNEDPRCVAAQAAYDALRDRSLASNRFAPVSYIDPILASAYSDEYKEETGSRPSGPQMYDDVVAFMDRLYAPREDGDLNMAA